MLNSRQQAMLARLVQRGVGNPSSMMPSPTLTTLVEAGYVVEVEGSDGWVTCTQLGEQALSVTVTLRDGG